jgi:hypothetical protein
MTFIGGQSIFSANLVASNISIISPNAAVAVDDTVYWMGKNNFYVYRGTTQKLACTVELKVFGDINVGQFNQVVAGAMVRYGGSIHQLVRLKMIVTLSIIIKHRFGISVLCHAQRG